MSQKIEIVDRDLQHTLEIRSQAAMMKMPAVIGAAFGKINNHMKEKQIACDFPPYVKYVNFSWDDAGGANKFFGFFRMLTYKWDMLIGFPVTNEQIGAGEIKSGKIEKGKYLQTLHKGPYRKVGETYKVLIAYMKENKLKAKNECLEIYLNDPDTTKQDDLETLVLIPLE